MESLDLALWLHTVARLRDRHLASTGADLESQLRHAYHLMQLAPRHLARLQTDLAEDLFEDLLGQEQFARAAAALAGPLAALHADNSNLLDVALTFCARAPSGRESQREAALVLFGVWLGVLLSVTERPVRRLPADPPPIPRAAQCEPQPTPIRR